MDLTADLAELQAEAESRMRDSCTIRARGTSTGDVDPVTGVEVTVPGALLYSGKCRLRMSGMVSGSSSSQVAGDQVTVSSPVLSIPVSAPRIPVSSIVEITGVPLDDPAGHLRLGLRAPVTGLVLGTDMTAQRVTVEAVTG
jgi:hypothetical protein